MSERIKVRGTTDRRTINWGKVSSVQYLGYFHRKGTQKVLSISTFEYQPGQFNTIGLNRICHSLQEVTDAVLANW